MDDFMNPILQHILVTYLIIGFAIVVYTLLNQEFVKDWEDVFLEENPDMAEKPKLTVMVMFAASVLWALAWPLLFASDPDGD